MEVVVEGRKLAYTVHFTSYKGVARRRQSRDSKWLLWPQFTGSDQEVTSPNRKSPGSGSVGTKTCIYSTFHFLQGCSSREEAVTWQKMTSRHLRWLEVPWEWCHWPEVPWKWL